MVLDIYIKDSNIKVVRISEKDINTAINQVENIGLVVDYVLQVG